MVCGCCDGDPATEKGTKFQAGGENDLSNGPVQDRGCTDILFIPIFIFAQVVFLIVTVAGCADGEPSKLYKPRDYGGAYCGSSTNWNNGPDTNSQEVLGFTMNVTSAVDAIMTQMVCSSAAKTALVDNGALGSEYHEDYLCDCCLAPCSKCSGSLDVGADFTSPADMASATVSRIEELTDLSKASELFSPGGDNAGTFSADSFWNEANKYFNQVCLPSCDTNAEALKPTDAEHREYLYSPPDDGDYTRYWTVLKASGPTEIKDAIDTAFKFRAYPKSMCPYKEELCVPFPGVKFGKLGAGYCSFEMAADVVDEVGGSVADAFASMGGTAMTNAGSESFGKLAGDFQRTVDTFIVVSVLAFVIGIVFLVILRFTVGLCVWFAVYSTVLFFAFGGAFLFSLSSQCRGASVFTTGHQIAVAVAVSGHDAALGDDDVSEAMTGNGADYRGNQQRTRFGTKCVNWELEQRTVFTDYVPANYPDDDLKKNYCRNPIKSGTKLNAKTIWCITADPEKPWEECTPIGVIQPVCHDGYEIENPTTRDVLMYSSYIVWALGGVWLIVVIVLAKRISLAIALNKVAAQFLAMNPTILLLPILQAIIGILWCVIWFYSASFLLSQVPSGYTSTEKYATYQEAYGTASPCAFWEFGEQCAGTPGKCNDKWPSGSVWRDNDCDEGDDGVFKCWRCAPPRYVFDLRFAVSFFVYLWNTAFNVAFGQIVVAMAVGLWFFSANKGTEFVVPKAFKTVCRYHIGSVAFGSFIVAVVQFIRYMMKYFEKQAEAQKNRVMVLVLKCVQCCIWCFEKCIQFLNKNAYIQIALLGKNFCTSAKKAFFLILRNALRFGTIAMLAGVVHAIGFVFIMTGTGVVGYLLVREMHPDVSPFMPVVIYLFMAYVISKVYMSVFGLAVDTSLQCFLAVEEMGVGKEYVPSVLKNFVDKRPKKAIEEGTGE